MGAWTEIVDFTFTANETTRAFTGLNITKDDFIKIVVTHVNGSSSGSALKLFPNTAAGVTNFDTASNYHSQRLQGDGSSVVANRANDNVLSFVNGSKTNTFISFFKISENGKTNFFTNELVTNDSGLLNIFRYTTSSNLTFNDPITSLTFTASVTNGLGTGSRIQIYRLDAEKVRDITVTSNSTQVDIPVTGSLDPAITKDSEYLLVSYIDNSIGDSAYRLFVNDNTTTSDYNAQVIAGNGSTASATRTNAPQFGGAVNGTKTLIHTHIKLSEIGAYTYQSYVQRGMGTSTNILDNWFGSSTAENITSITKLNIVASTTNAIGSGSRFELYKLK
jgi:hypothetical protein